MFTVGQHWPTSFPKLRHRQTAYFYGIWYGNSTSCLCQRQNCGSGSGFASAPWICMYLGRNWYPVLLHPTRFQCQLLLCSLEANKVTNFLEIANKSILGAFVLRSVWWAKTKNFLLLHRGVHSRMCSNFYFLFFHAWKVKKLKWGVLIFCRKMNLSVPLKNKFMEDGILPKYRQL